MAYLGYKTLEDVNRMTLSEYFYRMYAREYEQLEEIRKVHDLAFAIRNVQATKKKGHGKSATEEYIFKSLSDIIDYESNYNRLNRGESIVFKNHDVKPPTQDLKNMLKQFANYNARKE